MYAVADLAVNPGFDDSAGIERGIQHGEHLARGGACIATGFAAKQPFGACERDQRWRFNLCDLPIGRDLHTDGEFGAVPAGGVIETDGAIFQGKAAPCPVLEVGLQRCRAEIGVEIAVAVPLVALGQVHLDARDRGERAPEVAVIGGQGDLGLGNRGGGQGDGAFNAGNEGQGGDFINGDDQFAADPCHGRGADLQGITALAQGAAATVCHGKAATGAIGGDVDAGVVLRVTPARPRIPRRKDRAYEADDADGFGAIVADPVDVPPCVTIGCDLNPEIRTVSIAAAACSPDSAAIGTPAPGCAPPPAR